MIEKTLFLVLITFSCHLLNAQGNIIYSIKVIDNEDKPLENIEVVAVEKSTLNVVEGKTNNEGICQLQLNNGKEWSISIGEIKKCLTATSVKFSIVEVNEVFVYDLVDYKRKKLQDKNRVNDRFKTIIQNIKKDAEFSPGNCFLVIKMTHPKGNVLKDININVVNVKDSLIYKSKTNENGNAFFILPSKNNYEIDVNSYKNYSYCDFGDEYTKRTISIQFAPTVLNEKVINDTIYQQVTASSEPSSERALMKISVRGGKRKGKKEPIYLRTLKTGKVYATKTNDNGEAWFLIPVNYVYMVDFNYQKNADAISLIDAKEMTKGEVSVTYFPDMRLEYPELYIPTTETLLLKSFNSFLKTQFEKPKDKPFILRIFNAKKINKKSKEALFRLTFSSSDSYGGGKRLPLNVALVLDKSGSMYCCESSESLKKALWEIGNSLNNKDILSIVLFDNYSYPVLYSKEDHMEKIELIIDHYEPGGGTNIFKGLENGVNEVRKGYDIDKSNKIILLTDGYGITPPKQITDYVEQKYKEGIEFSTIGLGLDFNAALLKLIAQKSNGTFNFVDNSVELTDVFLKEVKGAFNYLVKDLKIEIYHNKKLIFSNLYGYPVYDVSDNRFSFNIGKVPQNKNEVAFLKFKLNKPSADIENEPLTVKVSYFDLIKKQKVRYEEQVKLAWTQETDTELLLNQEEKKLYAIAILHQSLKTMAEAHENKDEDRAKEALKEGIKQVEEIFPNSKPKEVKKLFEEMDNYIKLIGQIKVNER